MGGIATVATAIEVDLAARLPRQNKKQREGLALLVATALDVRDVNLMELAAALPGRLHVSRPSLGESNPSSNIPVRLNTRQRLLREPWLGRIRSF